MLIACNSYLLLHLNIHGLRDYLIIGYFIPVDAYCNLLHKPCHEVKTHHKQ